MKIDIPITKQSEQYIKDVFSQYKEVDEIPNQIKGRCIIHMYPYEDTRNEDGTLSGYGDAMLLNLHIYNTDDKTVWKTSYKDALDVRMPCNIKIFKDLSTMVVIDGGVELHSFQAFEVSPIGYYDKWE